MRKRPFDDRGGATVWSALACFALCAVFAAALGLGQAVHSRHRAGGAADLAALAAAERALLGEAAACTAARRVAAAQGARLLRCAVSGEVADVVAAARTGRFTAEVRARAGPPSPAGPRSRGGHTGGPVARGDPAADRPGLR